MAKLSITYSDKRVSGPLSFWVHKAIDSDIWDKATRYDPPMPAPVPGMGYPKYQIEYRGHALDFFSKEEINHCIEVLSKKVLPTTQALARKSGYPDYQHLHWLTRWPGDIKSWKSRQEIIGLLAQLVEKATSHNQPG